MSALQVVQQWGDWEAIYCTVVGVASVAVHWGVQPRWWKDHLAKHLMAYMAAIAAVFVLSTVRILAGTSLDTLWFAILRLVVFTGVPVVMTWRLAIQWDQRFHHNATRGSVRALAEALTDVGYQAGALGLDDEQAERVAALLREALPRPVLAALAAGPISKPSD